MNLGSPTAIIVGTEEFGAKKLAKELVKRDINVIGIGEDSWWDEESGEIDFRPNLESVEEKVNYIFDFKNDKRAVERAKNDGAKLTEITINEKKSLTLPEGIVDVRGIELKGVYGEEMGDNAGGLVWLTKALRLAVMNKNLVLPGGDKKLRLLNIDDAVEAILRATLLSATAGQVFQIEGEEIEREELAKTLIEEAKMTRYKVVEERTEELWETTKDAESEWRKLRWRPEITFKKGLKETLQYFFAKVDGESRQKMKNKKDGGGRKVKVEILRQDQDEKKIKEKKGYEVVVEPDFVPQSVTATGEGKLEEKEPEVFPEIKPILWKKNLADIEIKNSNNRPVAGIPDEEEIEEEEIVPEVKAEPVKTEPVNKKPRKKWKRWIIIGSLGMIIMLVIWWTVVMAVWWRETLGLPAMVTEGKYTQAETEAVRIDNGLDGNIKIIEDNGLNQITIIRRLTEAMKVWRDGLDLGQSAIKLAAEGEVINGAVFDDKDIDWIKELAITNQILADTQDKIGILQARLGGDWGWLPGKFKDELTVAKSTLEESRQMADTGGKLAGILPDLIGLDGKRRDYMVLFQNESELRPTGGFIGSYGMLSFEEGKLNDLAINDIYDADGQLKGHVEPPEPIKDYLGEASWFMRDANWDPNFPGTAKNIEWFLDKETGRSVDGVIGIDLAVAKSILEVTGPVPVPDFKQTVNKDNLYELAEFYAEKNSFPGSDQKASFLGDLGKQLFEGIKSLNTEQRWQLIKNLVEQFNENEIQMTVNTQDTENVLAGLGWDGAMYSGKCPGDNCFADYLMIDEANLGVNKANYFLYRSVDQTVDIQNQTLARVVKITYENTSKSSNWPGGDYKDYLRIYIPATSNIAEVSITDPNLGKTVFQSDNLTVNTIGDKKEVGFLAEVPFNSKRTVEIRYTDTINLTAGKTFNYLQYIQKQSGFGDTGLVSLVTWPSNWQVTQVQPAANVVGGKLLFNQKLSQDIKMGVMISK